MPEEGEVHRLTIDGHPLEETVSSPAIRHADHARSGRERTVEEICAAARDGDRDAHEVVASAMRALGAALRPWVERFEADRVVVGGSIARSWDVIEAPLRAGLALDENGDLVRAALGSRAPLVGAASAWASGARRLSR